MAEHVTSPFSRTKLAHLSLVVGGRTTPAEHAAPPVKPQVALESVPCTNTAEWETKARNAILALELGDTGFTFKQAIDEINRVYHSPASVDMRRAGQLMHAFDAVGMHVCPFESESPVHACLLVVRPKDLCKSAAELKIHQQFIKIGMTLG